MNKKMRELIEKMTALQTEAEVYLNNKDIEKFNEIKAKIDEAKKEYEAEKAMEEIKKANATLTSTITPIAPATQPKESSEAVFAKAVRGIITKTASEGVLAKGGYTVPEDISTKIEKYKDATYSLAKEIKVENVKTNKGARTYQSKGEGETFKTKQEIKALGDNDKLNGPNFERVDYEIEDRAGFMVVTNDLIEDSDANIVSVLTEYIGETGNNTDNANVLALVGEKTETTFADVDDIKKAINITLGQAYKANCKIFTNDDGLQFLDTLKDGESRYMLTNSLTEPGKLQIAMGATVIPVVVIPNKVLASTDATGGKKDIPFIVGDLKEYAVKFDRKNYTIKASDTATIGSYNAFADDTTILRVVERSDYVVKDADAIVRGKITA